MQCIQFQYLIKMIHFSTFSIDDEQTKKKENLQGSRDKGKQFQLQNAKNEQNKHRSKKKHICYIFIDLNAVLNFQLNPHPPFHQ